VIEFRVLGSLEVVDHDDLLALGAPKQRALLAILLVHRGEAVSSERLIDALWGEQPPASANKIVQGYVSNLRKALGDGLLVTEGGGYMLRVERGQFDVDRFEMLVAQGREALEAGDALTAAAVLREALGVWRGPPLADFTYYAFAQAPIARLEELQLAAVEERVEADLALGRHREVVAELTELVERHPLRERLRGQLMIALYRAGRQSDALSTYRELSHRQREELGLEPGRALRELEVRILQQDPSLEQAARAVPAWAGSLPRPATSFVGRARELAEVSALLHEPDKRLVTLTGAGGSGKTRLAVRVAEACAGNYRDGAWFVGFADITDPELISPTICQALRLAEEPGVTPARRLREWLRERELLLVLDNLEQLTPEVGVLGELLADCPDVGMLVTSRVPLHLAGEQQYEVPVLERGDAIELFVARAKAVAPDLVIERETAGAVCDRLDRLPLAIELGSARTKILSPAEILARLERRLPVLAAGPRDAPRRQRTLQATIDWSYALLTSEEQRLFTRLAVFAGGCTLQAAEAVADAELDTLEALVDRSLVRSGSGRYRMLQTLREYALEKLARSGEEDHLRHTHADWFVALLHAHGLDASVKSVKLDLGKMHVMLEQERENFRAALEWAEQTGLHETVARLAAPLTWLWHDEGSLSEADRWLGVARERSLDYPLALQALVLKAARLLAWAHGAYQEAVELGEQALAIYRELGDLTAIVAETSSQAVAVAHLGDLPRARARLVEALALTREHELNHWMPVALVSLADIEIAQGALDHAQALCEEALTIAPEADSSAGVVIRINLAHIANLERRHADAAELAQEALNRGAAIGQLVEAAAAALMLAWSLAELEQPERAARLLGAALEFFRHTGTVMQWSNTAGEQAVRDALEAQLDEQTLQVLIDEGRTMTLDQFAREEFHEAQQRA
jgi:predicted ATPase/DNA-binding SARP family transcriptional activator